MQNYKSWLFISTIAAAIAVLSICAAQSKNIGIDVPQATTEMRQYCTVRYGLYFADTAYSALVYLAILQSGLAGRLRDFCQAKVGAKFVQIALYFAIVVALVTMAKFPLLLYSGHLLEHQYHLSNLSFGEWALELLKKRAIFLALGSIVCVIAFSIIERGKGWSLKLFAVLLPLSAFLVFIYPIIVDPLFNDFKPMEQGTLLERIHNLERKAGIEGSPVLVVDKSRQTKKINAYVTGLFGSSRIVIWDTALKALPEEELLSVVAHEVGHYALQHVLRGFLLASACTLVSLLLLEKFQAKLLRLLPTSWQVKSVTDLTMIPVVLLAIGVIDFVFDPIVCGVSRHVEHEADAFALDLTDDGPALARSFITISKENLADPDPPPFIEFWLFSHPSLRRRIEFALSQQD